MGKCASITGLLVALVAILLGGIISGAFTELGLIASFTDFLEAQLDYPNPTGLWPATVRTDVPHFSYDDVKPGSLNDAVALVTGANVGLGKENARQLAVKGATVVIACRNEKKCEAAAKEINADCKAAKSVGSATPLRVDTSSFASVKSFLTAFMSKFNRLDIFVMNAGIAAGTYEITADGIEKTFHTNHVGHFQMLMGLKPLIEQTAAKAIVRIVAVSSASHYDGEELGIPANLELINSKEIYFKYDRYGLTKLANVLLANEVTNRFENSANIISTSCHPGMVATEIWEQVPDVVRTKLTTNPTIVNLLTKVANKMKSQMMWSVPDGTLTQVYLSTLVTKQDSGKYFHPIARKVRATKRAQDPREQASLWDFSLELVKDLVVDEETGAVDMVTTKLTATEMLAKVLSDPGLDSVRNRLNSFPPEYFGIRN